MGLSDKILLAGSEDSSAITSYLLTKCPTVPLKRLASGAAQSQPSPTQAG